MSGHVGDGKSLGDALKGEKVEQITTDDLRRPAVGDEIQSGYAGGFLGHERFVYFLRQIQLGLKIIHLCAGKMFEAKVRGVIHRLFRILSNKKFENKRNKSFNRVSVFKPVLIIAYLEQLYYNPMNMSIVIPNSIYIAIVSTHTYDGKGRAG
jgi:hypothetical protein